MVPAVNRYYRCLIVVVIVHLKSKNFHFKTTITTTIADKNIQKKSRKPPILLKQEELLVEEV